MCDNISADEIYNCKYCKVQKKSKGSTAQHQRYCLQNPNREQSSIHVVNTKEEGTVCEFCKKDMGRSNGKRVHKTYCGSNPNRIVRRGKTVEEKEHLSRVMAERMSNPDCKIGIFNTQHEKVANLLGVEWMMQSSYEIKLAKWFNNKSIEWNKSEKLVYVHEYCDRIYIPDFYLPAYNIYFEVKGYFKEEDKSKMRIVLEQNDVVLYLITKSTIDKLDSLNSLDEITDGNKISHDSTILSTESAPRPIVDKQIASKHRSESVTKRYKERPEIITKISESVKSLHKDSDYRSKFLEGVAKVDKKAKSEKISKALRESITNGSMKLISYAVTDPNGVELITDNIVEFCAQRGLISTCLRAVATGVKKSYKGYTCYKL